VVLDPHHSFLICLGQRNRIQHHQAVHPSSHGFSGRSFLPHMALAVSLTSSLEAQHYIWIFAGFGNKIQTFGIEISLMVDLLKAMISLLVCYVPQGSATLECPSLFSCSSVGTIGSCFQLHCTITRHLIKIKLRQFFE
jgi:hypothetical protein